MSNSNNPEREQAKYDRWVAEQGRMKSRQAESLAYLQMRTHEPDNQGRYLTSIKVKSRHETVGDWLAVVTVDGDQGDQVAFGSADELIGALVMVANRWMNGQLKFKEQKPYESS